MAYLLDGIVLVLFILMVFSGIKRGFIKTVTGVLSFVLALVLSSLLAGPVASLAYDAFVEPKVLSSFGESAETGEITADQVNEALASLPSFVTDQLRLQGITSGEELLDQVDEGSTSLAQDISDWVAPTVKTVLEPLCLLILFIVLRFILGLILRALNLLAKIPGIKQVNKVLGVIAGIIEGLLWAFFAVLVMDVLAASGLISSLTPQVMESTVLVEWLTTINPMGSAFQAVLALS